MYTLHILFFFGFVLWWNGQMIAIHQNCCNYTKFTKHLKYSEKNICWFVTNKYTNATNDTHFSVRHTFVRSLKTILCLDCNIFPWGLCPLPLKENGTVHNFVGYRTLQPLTVALSVFCLRLTGGVVNFIRISHNKKKTHTHTLTHTWTHTDTHTHTHTQTDRQTDTHTRTRMNI